VEIYPLYYLSALKDEDTYREQFSSYETMLETTAHFL